MNKSDDADVEAFFEGHPHGLAVFRTARELVSAFGPAEVRVSKTQVALRRRRGFAYVWMPGRWLKKPDAEVVLSIAAGTELHSKRFKQVVHPANRVWMHHLKVRDLAQLDSEVAGWLRQAYEDAG